MNDDLNDRVGVAEARFGLIAPTVNGTLADTTMSAYFKRVSESPVEMPDGQRYRPHEAVGDRVPTELMQEFFDRMDIALADDKEVIMVA